jgi:hypothetical protein
MRRKSPGHAVRPCPATHTRSPAPHARATRLAAAIVAACIASATAQAAGTLTVYSGDFEAVSQSEAMPGGPGFALVERDVAAQWRAGETTLAIGDMPRALDAASVVVTPPPALQLRGQRFDFATASQEELLRRALGQVVVVEQAVGDTRQTYTGTLIAAGNGLTLRLPDGRIKVLSSYAGFELPRLPEGVVNEPTLVLQLAAAAAGNGPVHVAYSTAGLAWRAEYTARLAGGARACRMALQGAALVVNRAGADFDDVALTLVAGEPHRERAQDMAMTMEAMPKARMVSAPAPMQAQASGEYQSYRLPARGDLPQGAVQRLPLVAGADAVDCERRYETNAPFGDWRPPFPIIDENWNAGDGQQQPVQATLRFANAKASGLGLPLPAGRVRVFDGADFLGESAIGHTAAGQDVSLVLGNAFDLGATRTRESFQLDRAGRTMTETVRLDLTNAKPEAVVVRVNERLGRWTDWELVSSSVPPAPRKDGKRGDAQVAVFDVPVPAGGKATLSYTVRYRWAADVKIP